MAKTIKTRIQQKHDTEANWNSAAKAATPFVPLKGELIIYDIDDKHDYERFKIGDGETVVDQLPFGVMLDKDNSLSINDGIATGNSSIAAGTADKEVLEDIVGTTFSGTVNPATAKDALTIAFGLDTVAETVGTAALGVANIAGAKGYYWHSIDFTNKTITLSTTRKATTWSAAETPEDTDPKWSVGDYISIRNKDRGYGYCSKITAVSGNVITVDSLPFTEDLYTSSFGIITYEAPYDRTIYAVYQENYLGQSKIKRWRCRGGTVDLGVGSLAIGMQNGATGIFSEASGRGNLAAGDYAHAEGRVTIASGEGAHAEGQRTIAKGYAAHAEGTADSTAGDIVLASGDGAHAEGYAGEATGHYSHKEGYKGAASGSASHAEGGETIASGNSSHAEGQHAIASGFAAHAEGGGTNAANPLIGTWKFNNIVTVTSNISIDMEFDWCGHALSSLLATYTNNDYGDYTLIRASNEDEVYTIYYKGFSEGQELPSQGIGWEFEEDRIIVITKAPTTEEGIAWLKANATLLSIGYSSTNPSTASGDYSHAEGRNTFASAIAAHAEGARTQATNGAAHAEGADTVASGNRAHAEGEYTVASGSYSHAEGQRSTASGSVSHAEGADTVASGERAHAEGSNTTAGGSNSHAEGHNTKAEGHYSHAEGFSTTASGGQSHAEGTNTKASGASSHAEGYNTTASGGTSHAEGLETIAAGNYQHVQGKYNILDSANKYAHIVGWGTGTSARKNIHTIDTSGNAVFTGTVTANGKLLVGKTDVTTEINNNNTKLTNGTIVVKKSKEADTANNLKDLSNIKNGTGENSLKQTSAEEASGKNSFAQGSGTEARGTNTATMGQNTVAVNANEVVLGNYNIPTVSAYDNNKVLERAYVGEWKPNTEYVNRYDCVVYGDKYYLCKSNHNSGTSFDSAKWILFAGTTQSLNLLTIGNGSSDTARSNAATLDIDGNAWFAGNVLVGEDKKPAVTAQFIIWKDTITFSIDGDRGGHPLFQCEAVGGMTWREFVESEYNTINLVVDDSNPELEGYVWFDVNGEIIYDETTSSIVTPDDMIIAERVYIVTI